MRDERLKELMESNMVQCPFCGEKDFDLEGLKLHYQAGWCDTFNTTIDLPYRLDRKEAQQDNKVDLQTATNRAITPLETAQ